MGNTLTSEEITEGLHIAVSKGDIEEVKNYLQKGANVENLIWVKELDENSRSFGQVKSEYVSSDVSDPAEVGISDRATEDAKELSSTLHLHKTIHINALHRAAMRKNNVEVIRLISEKTSNIDQQDSGGNTALHYAAAFPNNQEALRLLIGHKPNANVQNAEGETVLFSSIKKGGDMQTIESLLKVGADPNIPSRDGSTSLHACASLRGIDPLIPGLLLRCGANPNLKNKHAGQTPLHVAAMTANKAVLLMLQYRAKVRLRDNDGRLPSDVAATEDIKRILLGEERELIGTKISFVSRIFPSSGTRQVYSVPLYPESPTVGPGFCTVCNRMITEDSARSNQQSAPGWYLDQYKTISGTGGCGQIILPSGEEIAVPADSIPVGSCVKISLKTAGAKEDTERDWEDVEFKLDLSIPVPGIQGRKELYEVLPVFTSLRLGGGTNWRCTREITWNSMGYGVLNLSLKAERFSGKKQFQNQKGVAEDVSNIPSEATNIAADNDTNEYAYETPTTKRNQMANNLLSFQQTETGTAASNSHQANVADALYHQPENIYDISDASEMEHMESDNAENPQRGKEMPVNATAVGNDDYGDVGNFCERQAVIINEHEIGSDFNSEEETSSDEVESYKEVNTQGHGNNQVYSILEVGEEGNLNVQDGEMYQELYEYVHSNGRIQHPIDNELPTITEEDAYTSDQLKKGLELEHTSRSDDVTQELRNSDDKLQQSDYYGNTKADNIVSQRDERNSTYSLDSGFVGNDDLEFEKQETTDNQQSI